MRIAYVGNFELDYSTETHVARDAEALGHVVDRIQEPRAADGQWVADLYDRAGDADLLLYSKTYGLPDGVVQVFRWLEARGVRTASYHLDLYAGLRRQTEIGVDPFWRTGTVFTADGDPRTTDLLRERSISHRWMPAAVVSDEAVPGCPRVEFDHDIVFVGSANYHPEWPWRAELIRSLSKRYSLRFHLYGPGVRIVRGLDLNDLYASAKIVVGDTLALPGHTNYWSDRYYETVGRGGFLIAPRVAGIEAHFTDGEHLVLYEPGDFDQVARLVDKYLDDEDARREIAVAGQAHVRAHHTYRHRVAAMLDALEY